MNKCFRRFRIISKISSHRENKYFTIMKEIFSLTLPAYFFTKFGCCWNQSFYIHINIVNFKHSTICLFSLYTMTLTMMNQTKKFQFSELKQTARHTHPSLYYGQHQKHSTGQLLLLPMYVWLRILFHVHTRNLNWFYIPAQTNDNKKKHFISFEDNGII